MTETTRERIERALGLKQVLVPVDGQVLSGDFNIMRAMDLNAFVALAQDAIVIDAEVEHSVAGQRHGQLWTKVSSNNRAIWAKVGGHGKPGKATIIVIPRGDSHER